MTEQTPETTEPQAAPEAPQAPPEQDTSTLPEWAREAIAKANREAAGYRTRLREAEPLAQRARELEEAQMTEQQRATEAANRARQDAEDARAEALRYRAAATHGIAPDFFDLLGSGDEETVSARAERVGSLLAAQREAEQLRAELEALRAGRLSPTTGRPVESLRPGASPAENQSEDDVLYNQLFGG